MKKKSYRILDVNKIHLPDLKAELSTSKRAIFGIDVAKSEVVVALGGDDGKSIALFKAKQPAELPQLLAIATALQASGYQVELVSESTSTYGDVLLYQARLLKLSVHRVSTKFVHDAKEIHDGVPSKHDAKDATLILWLHATGKTRPWVEQEPSQRRAKAVVSRREIHVEAYVANAGRMEALLARHWPELLALGTAIGILLLRVLGNLPSPKRISANPDEAKRLLSRYPSGDTVSAIVASATTSQGVVMMEEEELQMSELANQMIAQRSAIERIDQELREQLLRDPVALRLSALVGPTTAMVLAADIGDVSAYASPRTLEKACGLNLRENSSGQGKSGLHITKRGPSRVRKYLYLTALRLLRLNPIVRAWYASRVTRGQRKMCAVIAVLRKLVRALIFVARGEEFRAEKLFDVRRLNLQQSAAVDIEPTLAEMLQLDETSIAETTVATPEPAASAPKERARARTPAGVARKNERAPSPPPGAPARVERIASTDSAAPPPASSPAANRPLPGRGRERPLRAPTDKVTRGAQDARPALAPSSVRALS